jgi:hypothetical protein
MIQEMETWIKQARVAALFRGLRLAQSGASPWPRHTSPLQGATPSCMQGHRSMSRVYNSDSSAPRLHQVVTRLYNSLGVDASPATPHRPCQIVFTNIVRGHHRRQPSTSTNSITSPPSPLMVNVKRRQDLLLLLATPRNSKQKIWV